uniref:Fungal lipase-type domain-containing protein n=1 Tax=Erythrolobus australicus TaxID=1077150 RepID=A0A7S1XI20_9RHOD|mmetsp:Transcript_4099/g.11267  ORF Transcript_4099/g.11267 Transcript_4099/m.11267 type:complete len:844 (+) Transcript_4099:460-2991(+)
MSLRESNGAERGATDGVVVNAKLPDVDGDKLEGFTGLEQLQKEHEDEKFSVNDSDDDFDQFGAEEETAVSLMLNHKSFTKLETISAREISLLLTIDNIIYLICTLYCVGLIIAYNTDHFKQYVEFAGYDGKVAIIQFDESEWQYFELSLKIVSFSLAVILAIVYTVRLMRQAPKDRTSEQMWVIFLAWAVATYLIPYDPIVKLLIIDGKYEADALAELRSGIIYSVQLAAFSTATVFYAWTTAHSYRLLKGRLPYAFYVPKLCLALTYLLMQVVARYVVRIEVSPVPLITFFSMIHLIRVYGVGYTDTSVTFVMALTVLEIWTFMWIVREVYVTKRVLQGTTYMRFRTKQIGFRFFLYNSLVFYTVFWILMLLFAVAIPPGTNLARYVFFDVFPYRSIYVAAPMDFLSVVYVATEAYVKLPADAFGWKGWFVSQPLPKERVGDEFKPMTYKKRETASFSGVFEDLGSNCFTMQTHTLMFNFAWYVYYHGTKKAENFKLKKDVFEFDIHKMISNKDTDTHVLVVDGTDRIVVAFRGTTSAQNLRTDIAIKFIRADAVLPTARDEEHIGFAEDSAWVYESPLFGKARVHQGFAEAYRSIAEPLLVSLKELYLAKRRPIFLTGHSLGGCLATLCSFDLSLSLGMGKREMFVSTFGAPRTGNVHFRDLYNDLCPIHWRIVLAPDIVTKLPKFTYKHCGKKVLITTGGELFLDPNALELKIWHGDASSVLYHRKASYLLAMRGWCELNHGDEYVPEFWPWPVSADDSKRFESIYQKSASTGRSVSSIGVPRSKAARPNHYKLLNRGDLVDKLDVSYSKTGVHDEMSPPMLWARLTRRLLLSQLQAQES